MAADQEVKLTINEEYAKRYEEKKRAEELSKLKDKYGDIALDEDEDSSSSSEEEDDTAEGITDKNDANFLRTLSLIKARDDRIYEAKVAFYPSEESDSNDQEDRDSQLGQKEAQMFLKDYERKRLLERGSRALVSDSEDDSVEGEDEGKGLDKKKGRTYIEEQEELKLSLKAAAQVDGSDTDGEEELLTMRHQTKEEKESAEKDYIHWLKGEGDRINQQQATDMMALKRYWTDPKLSQDEAFLRDYLLNRGYIDMDAYRVPSYKDVVGEDAAEEGGVSTRGAEEGEGEEEGQLASSDEEEVERQEQFERQYNFRFEEPGGADIASFPRHIASSVRRGDDRRKVRRKEREERKETEKEKKREELRRLKNLKRQEIKEKLQTIKALTGNPSVGFSEEDLEGDFDPAKYDEIMQGAFDDEYYMEEETVKPELSDDDDDDEGQWASYGEGEGLHSEDPGFIMDADYMPLSVRDDEKGKSASDKEKKRQYQKKPLFDPEDKTFEEYFDEYYKLDFEDIIGGDTLCRFNYREVMPNSYGLTTEEILSADDKELNRWVSLKKAVRFSSEAEEKEDRRKYRRKAKDKRQKKKVLASIYQSEECGAPSGGSPIARGRKKGKDGKRPGKLGNSSSETPTVDHSEGIPHKHDKIKGKSKAKSMGAASPHAGDSEMAHSSGTVLKSGGRKGKRKHAPENRTAVMADISSKRLKAYGLTTRTTKKRQGIRKIVRSKRTA